MPTSPDRYLQGLLDKDPTVVQSIYTNFASRIEAMVVQHGGSRESARDVFQEALLVIWRKAQQPDFELTSSFYTFLYSICYFTWQRQRKKKDNNTVTIAAAEGSIDGEDIQRQLETNERTQLFRSHLAALSDECRRLITLFLAGKKMQEIAALLGIDNDHAARNRKYRCQKKLEQSIITDPRYREITDQTE